MLNIRPTALFLLLLLATAPAGRARACAVCIPVPRQTAADLLLEAATVVRARENPDKPYSYAPVEVLKGPEAVGDIDLFMDSKTRRWLQADPGSAAVLVQKEAGAPWRGLGIPVGDYEALIRQVLAAASRWRGAGRSRSRVEFFAALLGHENPQIYELAYLEVARAPYDWIRELEISWPVDEIRTLLDDFRFIEWHPLAILLLAQRGGPQDRRTLIESFISSAEFGLLTNLAAHATTYIELEQGEAVTFIEDHYFRNPSRKREELSAVLTAVATICSVTHPHLRDRFVESFAVLLGTHPGTAGEVAPMLASWRKWELTGVLAKILETQPEDPGALQVQLYLSQAPRADGF